MSKLTVLTIEATLQRQLVLGFIQGHDFGFGDGEGDFVLVAPGLDPLDHAEEFGGEEATRDPRIWGTKRPAPRR